VIPVVEGSSPFSHPIISNLKAGFYAGFFVSAPSEYPRIHFIFTVATLLRCISPLTVARKNHRQLVRLLQSLYSVILLEMCGNAHSILDKSTLPSALSLRSDMPGGSLVEMSGSYTAERYGLSLSSLRAGWLPFSLYY
jgi:hypothetical protein